jgi:hypothetical protein
MAPRRQHSVTNSPSGNEAHQLALALRRQDNEVGGAGGFRCAILLYARDRGSGYNRENCFRNPVI